MRPIDADKMKRKIKYIAKSYGVGTFPMEKLLDAIDKCAIEAEPVRHGEWTENKSGKGVFDYYFICSECHKNTPDKAFFIAPDFCPNCGTKMDGGANIP